jgi:hypothetical protein
MDTQRILRECAVDLVRASDLSPALALDRVERVRAELFDAVAALHVEAGVRRLLRDDETSQALRVVA